ncbi:MAG TPA: Mrp/NBP35 family ATP-binding protein, partial [Nitrospirales bacterium]|nr:Mrp/NBP35 family ATP-binding protein [Nitrospirales bacterium]
MASVTEQAVIDALRTVMEPELHKDLITLNMVKDVKIDGGAVKFTVVLTTPACPLKTVIKESCDKAVGALPGVTAVEVDFTANVQQGRSQVKENLIPTVKNTIAVSSGKGGVGKTTVAVNLAVGLALQGAKVGLMDADVYGPNVPMMMGVERPPEQRDGKLAPAESHGVKMISMGFFVPEDTPLTWRGPMIHTAIQQFLRDVIWGDLDYLVVDLPPGTGDAQLSIAQLVPLTGAVIVTTPQEVALHDSRKGLVMFQKVNVPLLGIVENMSYYVCGKCGERTEIFSYGGGERAAEKLGIPFLGRVPIDPAIRAGGDMGMPLVVADPDSPQAKAFM